MNDELKPILYSFRRCPWAIRARLALMYAGIDVELREVKLCNKPKALLDVSPNATVPVLVLPNDHVINESFDIMVWAIKQNDPDQWCEAIDHVLLHQPLQDLLKAIQIFKYQEDHAQWQQNKVICEQWLVQLNDVLKDGFLTGDKCRLVDAALFPVIRQVSKIDSQWFESLKLIAVKNWLQYFYDSEFYAEAMVKHPVWVE